MKISENYEKFGKDLTEMFENMKKYKNRDDIYFITEEFVAKELQIKKL